MHIPKVSVILPVYNGEDYLRLAINSVLAQTFQDFELIIVDDGSTDSTPSIIESYSDQVRSIRQDNAGVGAAFNHGIRISKGRYISWLSHDDIYLPTKIEKQFGALANLDSPAACYTDVEMIDSKGSVYARIDVPHYPPGEALRHLIIGGEVSVAAYSIFFDRRCLDKVGMYNEKLRYAQDADMLIRLARFFPLVHVPEKLVRFRDHGARGSRTKDKRLVKEVRAFRKGWLNQIALVELFPNLTKDSRSLDKAKAQVWLGDGFMDPGKIPFWTVAVHQYKKALRESPLIIATVISRLCRLVKIHFELKFGKYYLDRKSIKYLQQKLNGHRNFHRLGLRTAMKRILRYQDHGR